MNSARVTSTPIRSTPAKPARGSIARPATSRTRTSNRTSSVTSSSTPNTTSNSTPNNKLKDNLPHAATKVERSEPAAPGKEARAPKADVKAARVSKEVVEIAQAPAADIKVVQTPAKPTQAPAQQTQAPAKQEHAPAKPTQMPAKPINPELLANLYVVPSNNPYNIHERQEAEARVKRAYQAASKTYNRKPRTPAGSGFYYEDDYFSQAPDDGIGAPKLRLIETVPQASTAPAPIDRYENCPDSDYPGKKRPNIFRRAARRWHNSNQQAVLRTALALSTCVLCVLFTVITLYTPFQQLYVSMRQNERLLDELAQNQERIDSLEQSVSSLQTAEGVQDQARETWGLVLPGEIYVNVYNPTTETTETAIPDDIKRGSGQNTSTWLTDILDQLLIDVETSSAQSEETDPVTITDSSDGNA